MPIPEVLTLLDQIKAIHEKKNSDYAAPGKSFENFERSAEIASWFKNDIDKSFTILIGTKLARLATLLNSDKSPNNESIADSFLDLSTYCILWSAYHQQVKIDNDAERFDLKSGFQCKNCGKQFGNKPVVLELPGSGVFRMEYYFCSDYCKNDYKHQIAISGQALI